MLKRRRRESADGAGKVPAAPTPSTPVEVGLLLRMVRERSGMGLGEIRDRIGVARVDIEALEQGRLEALHVEQAAVVALTRYAELLGKDPGPYLEVLRRHWPRPATALDAVRTVSTGETPVAHLATASRLLARLADRSSEAGPGIGLGEVLRRELERSSGSTARAIAALGPAVTRAKRPPALPEGEPTGGFGPPQALPAAEVRPGGPRPAGDALPAFPQPSLPRPPASTPASPPGPPPAAPPEDAEVVEVVEEGPVGGEPSEGKADPPGVSAQVSRPVSAGRSVTRFLAERLGLDRPLDEVAGSLAIPGTDGIPPSGVRTRD